MRGIQITQILQQKVREIGNLQINKNQKKSAGNSNFVSFRKIGKKVLKMALLMLYSYSRISEREYFINLGTDFCRIFNLWNIDAGILVPDKVDVGHGQVLAD